MSGSTMASPGPDGWPAGFRAPPDGWPAPTRRLTEQRTEVDETIDRVGIDWDQGRTRYIGAAGAGAADADFATVRERVRSLADIEPVIAEVAARREAAARAASEAGDSAAHEEAFVAALLWGTAEWPFFLSADVADRAREHSERKLACYDAWMSGAPHPVRRLRIGWGGGSLSAVLHLPPGSAGASGSIPAVLHFGGMDSFKEHAVAMRDDRYLTRGMARLIFDGPGQGEAIFDGAYLSRTSMLEAGLAALDLLRQQPEIDPGRIGISGVSFGSWWATELAGHADVVATAVWAVVHENGLRSLFEHATPTFKARLMAMAGFVDEDAFDAFARRWSLDEAVAGIDAPYLVIAGEDDELSPIENTYSVLSRVDAPRRLVVYRGERHSVGGSPAARLGPSHLDTAADWFADRFDDRELIQDATIVEPDGSVAVQPLDPWLAARRTDASRP